MLLGTLLRSKTTARRAIPLRNAVVHSPFYSPGAFYSTPTSS